MVDLVTISVLLLAAYIAYYFFRSDNYEPGSMRGKRVLVTGASSGIGEEMAYHYSRLGAKLVITARRAQLLDKVAGKCRALGANVVEAVPADMSIPADRERLAAKTEETLGGLDVLILNHATVLYKWSEGTPEYVTLVNDAVNIGFLSYVHLTALFRKSLAQSHGCIGVTSSVLGKYSLAGLTHYNAVKYALQGYFSSLRQEFLYGKTDISVTVALFGLIETDQIKTMYRENFPNSGLESRATNVEDAVDAYVRAVATRSHELVYPRTAQVLLFVNRIIPRWFESAINWYNDRLKNQ